MFFLVAVLIALAVLGLVVLVAMKVAQRVRRPRREPTGHVEESGIPGDPTEAAASREAPDADLIPPGLKLEGDITLDAVTFAYPGTGRVILREVSFRVERGELVSLFGAPEAGKSTLAKLVARIYVPDRGSILIDGVHLGTIDPGEYRRRLGYVQEETFLFRGTVMSNITYGRPDATRDEVEAATRALGAQETLDALTGGLEAPVFEEGRNLTGPQRQLISIVRAWLVDPDIFILDEATGGLDGPTEQQVIRAVRETGRTVLLLTNRPQVAAQAGRIVVLDGGTVTADGSHADLVAGDNAYARMWAEEAEWRP